MFYIIGLGNPTPEYFNTRHNVGRLSVEKMGDRVSGDSWKKDNILLSQIKKMYISKHLVVLLLPEVFMNQSGLITGVLKNKYQSDIENIIVIHDDVDLSFGSIKVSVGKGHAGNNGVKSIIKSLNNNNFTRVRIGIAPVDEQGKKIRPAGGGALEKFVLRPFSVSQQKKIPEILENVENILVDLVENGKYFVMNKYN